MSLIGAAWAFLRGIPWQVWLALALAFGVWRYGESRHADGAAEVRQDWVASVERGKAELARLKEQQGKVTVRTEVVYLDKVKVIREKGETIIQRIPAMVPADACLLPAGFRVLHDAAAANLPDAVGRADAGAAGPEVIAWRPWNRRPAAGGGPDGDRELLPVSPGIRAAARVAALGAGSSGLE
jgi:hypothetical protein